MAHAKLSAGLFKLQKWPKLAIALIFGVSFINLTAHSRRLWPVTRLSLVLIALLTAFGVVFALLPGRKQELREEVTLSGVKMVLYPQADPNARWTFEADEVIYNPNTQESLVKRPQNALAAAQERRPRTARPAAQSQRPHH
jgi:hypothetical protein